MIDHFTTHAASRYGSRAAFAIIDALHAEPSETFSPLSVNNPLWHAMHPSAKQRQIADIIFA
jgi:hypothetical protein